MQIIDSLKDNWSLILLWMAIFLLIILYFEHRRWNMVWNYNSPTKFLPKSEYYFIYADYLKWWGNFLNNPERIASFIHENFLSYLETKNVGSRPQPGKSAVNLQNRPQPRSQQWP